MQEDLIELHGVFARDVCSKKNLSHFWFTICKSYERIAEPAVQTVLLFPSTWLCESTFSVSNAWNHIKTQITAQNT